MSNFLEPDNSLLENKLRIVKNEYEDEFNELISDLQHTSERHSSEYKIIKPDPGLCVKSHQLENNEKVFINICQSHGIPAPEDISVEQLTEILASETPSTYKIPMSITQLRITKDKASKDAIVCDVAIHPDFFRKIELNNIFRDFLITIVFEALDTKYNLQINRDTWIILKNRKCIGNLEKHRVQNRDAVKVYESYQNPTKEHKSKIKELSGDNERSEEHKSPLIKEIKMNAIQKIDNKNQGDGVTVVPDTAKTFTAAENKEPQHRLFKTVDNMENGLLVAEFFLPDIAMQNEINLELNKDRILLEARRSGYLFESFLPNNVDDEKSDAEFNMNTRILRVKMPIAAA